MRIILLALFVIIAGFASVEAAENPVPTESANVTTFQVLYVFEDKLLVYKEDPVGNEPTRIALLVGYSRPVKKDEVIKVLVVKGDLIEFQGRPLQEYMVVKQGER